MFSAKYHHNYYGIKIPMEAGPFLLLLLVNHAYSYII